MPLTRTPHWATRELHQFLLDRAPLPFAWGTNDCSLFAADAIQSFTGVDLAADFRGKYTDEASAMALVKKVTGTGTIESAAAYCAQKQSLSEYQHPLMAKRGDLALVQNGDTGVISGIVHLNGRHVVTVGQRGLLRISILHIKRAWAI